MVRTKTPHPKRPAEAAAHRPPRRNSRGLTTLEWLLIVAAVAGLAALAVVLVQNVVDDTAEQISGSSARLTAALVAAQKITDDCKNTSHADRCDATTDEAVKDAKAKCDRLTITYGDAFTSASTPKTVKWFNTVGSGEKFDGTDLTTQPPPLSCHVIDAS